MPDDGKEGNGFSQKKEKTKKSKKKEEKKKRKKNEEHATRREEEIYKAAAIIRYRCYGKLINANTIVDDKIWIIPIYRIYTKCIHIYCYMCIYMYIYTHRHTRTYIHIHTDIKHSRHERECAKREHVHAYVHTYIYTHNTHIITYNAQTRYEKKKNILHVYIK